MSRTRASLSRATTSPMMNSSDSSSSSSSSPLRAPPSKRIKRSSNAIDEPGPSGIGGPAGSAGRGSPVAGCSWYSDNYNSNNNNGPSDFAASAAIKRYFAVFDKSNDVSAGRESPVAGCSYSHMNINNNNNNNNTMKNDDSSAGRSSAKGGSAPAEVDKSSLQYDKSDARRFVEEVYRFVEAEMMTHAAGNDSSSGSDDPKAYYF